MRRLTRAGNKPDLCIDCSGMIEISNAFGPSASVRQGEVGGVFCLGGWEGVVPEKNCRDRSVLALVVM